MARPETAPGVVPRAWALWLVQILLVAAAGVAGWLGWSHLHLAHGAGAFDSLCSVSEGFDCDAVNTSDWSELRGVPISIWALPLYAMMGWLAGVGRRADGRGAGARFALTALAGTAVAVSAYLLFVMVVELGTGCIFCLSLDVLHASVLVLALLPPGGRAPRLPAGLDLFACFAAAVGVAGTTFQFSLIWAEKLDREAAAVVMGEADGPASTAVATEQRDGRVVTLPSDRHDVPLDRFDASIGPRNAKVVVVEFADFECGYCKKLSHALAPLEEQYSDRVRFVFKHYPMDQACNSSLKRQHHDHACLASKAAICAQDQGRFWEYHDVLFKNQKRLERKDLLFYADQLGLDAARFAGCLEGTGAEEQLREDISHGGYLEISGTPRTYVNGRMFKGAVSTAMLEAAILLELGEVETTDDGRVRTKREVVVEGALPAGPTEMVHVSQDGLDFWMDAVESSVDEAGRAVAQAGVTPPNVSWTVAQAACEAAGKRMCRVEEWVAACQGTPPRDDDGDGSVLGDYVEGREYPYGNGWREGYCHDGADADRGAPVKTGSLGGCRTPEGVHDLAGNLAEWVGATPEDAVLLGGAWYYGEKASCARSYDVFGPGMANRTTGFRCCADEAVALASAAPAPLAGGVDLVEEGESLPSFIGPGLDGSHVASSMLEGKVGLVNFWASWCGPCRKELPKLAELYGRHKDAGFEIVAVNVDRTPEDARRFLQGGALPFPVLLDPRSEVVGRFDVVSMPTTVLVDRDGRIVARHAGWSDEWFAELESEVVRLLGR